jgi:hypothetical protein
MTVALINRSILLGGNGTIAKVPLKGRLRSLGSKYAQEKRAKSDTILESRSPCEYGTNSSPVSTYSREEPEVEAEIGGVTPLLAPTALRPSMSSPSFTTFDKKRHGMSLSRKFPSSTRKQTQQIRSPRQSKKALKKLSPSLAGSGAAAHSPWVNPSPTVQSYPSTATRKEECGEMDDDIHSVSFQEHDLPHTIRPCYKFVPIEMAEMMEEEEANVINTYDSNDYDICSDEYLASHAEETDLKKQKKKMKKDKTSKSKSLSQKKKNKQQKKKKPKNNTPVTPHIDKYAMHFQHKTTKPKSSWWASLERGMRYSQCCY